PRPRIEDFLVKVPELHWPPLLTELLRVECELRRRAGERPTADEYRSRFSGHSDVVASVFAAPGRPSLRGPGRSSSLSASLEDASVPQELADHPEYEILRKLGEGGMGVVYLAQHRLMGRYEVLKVMGQHIVEQPGVLDRFVREIRAVARLRHPNI